VGLLINISVQSIMHLHLGLGLKHFGIFFNIACLLYHLMRGFKGTDIAGSKTSQNFRDVTFCDIKSESNILLLSLRTNR